MAESVRPVDPRPHLPLREIDVNPTPQDPIPAVGDLTAGDGASRGYRPTLSPTMGSTNVPMPDNTGPVNPGPDPFK